MEQPAGAPLRKTPLNARHRASGAKMVSFAGWDMPLEYSGIAPEHMAVRTRAGLFDVSHMGQIEIAGAEALAAVQLISCNDAATLEPGQAQYSALTTDAGAFVDDLLVYRLKSDHFLLVVNAANVAKDYAWIRRHIGDTEQAAAVDTSSRYALLAVQGPRAIEAVQPLTGIDLQGISHYRFSHGEVAGVRAMISRTGYTGEDGVEIFLPPQSADRVWQAILAAGGPFELIPCGLGARDTLRLEAGMRLYGHDIDETTTVLEAGLGWIVGWTKPDFIGASALHEQKASGVARRLAGFEMIDPGIARHGYDVWIAGLKAGIVTSGTRTPLLGKAIGFAYLPTEYATPGQEFDIDIRGRRAHALVAMTPFHRRTKG